ncbi:11129_t:CDS:2 [Ambispora gerdemannii]|uniref:DASH complex subunit ASK1 n=1 Tax=Ambispora gerdemannii TaxID=144530 RepID=A0A9N9ADE9_9GLOM|nr:11129_t:CDS:2 [Ambispora gerdemannii]
MAFSTTKKVAEQLEWLEQNITLTLQEIDHNFSSCHQTVTTRVLPQIERYAEVSRDVCENAKLWLSFFESLDLNSSATTDSSPDSRKSTISLFGRKGDDSKTSKSHSAAVSSISSTFFPPPSLNHHQTPISGSKEHFFTPVGTSTPFNSEKIPRLFRRTFSRQVPTPDSLDTDFSNISNYAMYRNNLPKIVASRSSKGTPYPRPPASVTSTNDSEYPDMSPPVTIQFSVPSSILLKTPAKEAAKCIVDEVLNMASPVPSTPSELNNASILPESVIKFDENDSDSEFDEDIFQNFTMEI